MTLRSIELQLPCESIYSMTALPASEKEGRAILEELKEFIMRSNVLYMAADFQFYYVSFNIPEKE